MELVTDSRPKSRCLNQGFPSLYNKNPNENGKNKNFFNTYWKEWSQGVLTIWKIFFRSSLRNDHHQNPHTVPQRTRHSRMTGPSDKTFNIYHNRNIKPITAPIRGNAEGNRS